MLPWPAAWSMGGKAGAQDDYWALEGLRMRGHEVLELRPNELSGFANLEPQEGVVGFNPWLPPVVNRWTPWMAQPLVEWAAWNARAVARGWSTFRRGDIDVVFGHSPYVAPCVRALSRHLHVPSVMHVYGSFLAPLLDQNTRLRMPEFWGWKVPVDRYVILNDGTEADRVAKSFGLSVDRFVFWRNGVDRKACLEPVDATAIRLELGLPPTTPLVFLACRLVTWKRVDRLLRAVPGVLAQVPDATFLIAGEGPLLADLQKLAAQLRIADHVRFLGSVQHNDVLDYMNAADLFTSVNDLSNVGNPLLEALACGKAIVTLDVGATRDIIDNGRNGLLVAPDDEEGLSRAFIRVLTDADLRERLASEARRTADCELSTWEERAAREAKLIEELCATRVVEGSRRSG